MAIPADIKAALDAAKTLDDLNAVRDAILDYDRTAREAADSELQQTLEAAHSAHDAKMREIDSAVRDSLNALMAKEAKLRAELAKTPDVVAGQQDGAGQQNASGTTQQTDPNKI